ncbi:MAG TPA: hypothetical protein VHW01_15135 [Polyangiaceae bacterium]|jgi:hypothetical protein|nr:hypothetical protein [Polyangiaceae bacterium]
MSLGAAVFAIASCTRVTDRVIEPVGGGDATTVPETADASLSPIGPIAHSPEREPTPDFRLVRSPELGFQEPARPQIQFAVRADNGPPQGGNAGTGGSAGYGGSDRRPVSTGGRGYL